MEYCRFYEKMERSDTITLGTLDHFRHFRHSFLYFIFYLLESSFSRNCTNAWFNGEGLRYLCQVR